MSATVRRCFVADGLGTAVVGPGVTALIGAGADDGVPALDQFYDVLAAGAGRDLVVQWLSYLAGTVLPSFAIAIDEGDHVRLLQRGSVLAIATDHEGGHQHLGMEPAIAWHEVVLESPARLFLHLVTGADPVSAAHPHDGGRCAARTIDLVGVPEPEPELVPEPEPELVPEPESEGATIARADLTVLLDTGIAGPAVPAVHCPDQHPNPPGAQRCRVCAAPIVDLTVTDVPRLVLGRIRLEDGSVVSLATPLLLGRNPVDGALVDGQPATGVRLPDPDRLLSRTHVELRIDGWQILVVDRGSVNGTVVHRGDGSLVELVAPVPALLGIGDRVVLGGATSFVLEADG